ncbi:MAG: alpha/beta fold hydrolase [Endozoicomonas sp.]
MTEQKAFASRVIHTPGFAIQSWQPGHHGLSKTLRVYIEGDGRAWSRKGRPSSDPTPRNRLVHNLMLSDPKPDIAYLARPCQFQQDPHCNTETWTFGRYDNSVIQSMSRALDTLKQSGEYQQLELVGYSGGATIALLLAARRNDILSIRTIAGNLDPAFTNRYHRVSPMPSAMNPVHFTDRLQKVPQLHFYGTDDEVIPAAVSRHYLSLFRNRSCIQLEPVVGASHGEGWAEGWGQLLSRTVSCY